MRELYKYTKQCEALIDLQDKAIAALHSANQALQLALSALERARAEQGYTRQFDFVTVPNNTPYTPTYTYSPCSTGGTGQAWGGQANGYVQNYPMYVYNKSSGEIEIQDSQTSQNIQNIQNTMKVEPYVTESVFVY